MAREGDFELITLQNGTRAVRNVIHGEVMHPSVGPWQEAQALYVAQSGLADKLQQPGAPLCVWDVGLGAGTNAVAALTCARDLGAAQRRELHVVSFEIDLAPLRLALADRTGFPFLQPRAPRRACSTPELGPTACCAGDCIWRTPLRSGSSAGSPRTLSFSTPSRLRPIPPCGHLERSRACESTRGKTARAVRSSRTALPRLPALHCCWAAFTLAPAAPQA